MTDFIAFVVRYLYYLALTLGVIVQTWFALYFIFDILDRINRKRNDYLDYLEWRAIQNRK